MQLEKSKLKVFTILGVTLLYGACGDGRPEPETIPEPTPPKVVTVDSSVSKKAQVGEILIDTVESTKAKVVKLSKLEEEKPKVKEQPKKVKKRPRAKINFEEKVFDFGFIMQGDTVQHDFPFTNTGKADLVVKRVKASCGCTTPLYPLEPVPPGENGRISVVFKSAGKLGRQAPHIEVYTNVGKIKLELKGFVDAERAKPPKVKTTNSEQDSLDTSSQ